MRKAVGEDALLIHYYVTERLSMRETANRLGIR